jgi:aspartyl-tRNA synthetase
MLLTGSTNLRETIAFPKTANATDLLSNAPSTVDLSQLEQLHIRTVPKPSSKPAAQAAQAADAAPAADGATAQAKDGL